jgi:hypothetical protein
VWGDLGRQPEGWLYPVHANPETGLVALLVWARVTGDTRSVTAGRMLVGVWLLGGVFMMISATIAGGGFSGPDGFKGGLIAIAMSLIPIYTFIMATYDGSLFALLLISMALFLVWVLPMSMGQRNAKA